jgi:hypothetical protein
VARYRCQRCGAVAEVPFVQRPLLRDRWWCKACERTRDPRRDAGPIARSLAAAVVVTAAVVTVGVELGGTPLFGFLAGPVAFFATLLGVDQRQRDRAASAGKPELPAAMARERERDDGDGR